MKTKEIDVYVPIIVMESFARAEMFTVKTRDMIDGSWLKAKLIIQLPERKAEITESKLRDCFDSFRAFKTDDERRSVFEFLEFSKQKLFGSEG